MSYPEGIMLQKVTGLKVGEYLQGLTKGDVEALAAAAWFAVWKDGDKSLRLRDITEDPDFRPLRDIEIDDDDEVEPEVDDAAEGPTAPPSAPRARPVKPSVTE